jgi:hypothetical protein
VSRSSHADGSSDSTAGLVRRAIEGVLPAPDGGPPMVMRNVRTRLMWLIGTFVGTCTGAVVGLLLGLAWSAVPNVPILLTGFVIGLLVGFLAAVVAAARLTAKRKKKGWGLVLLPLTLLAAPLLVLGTGWERFRRRK